MAGEVIVYQRFWMRRDTEANWAAANPALAAGEFGVVLDGAGNPLSMKMGDGATAWLSLPYLSSPMVVLAGGTANALTATFDPVPVLYDGLVVPVRAAAANTTAATLAVNGGTARAITKQGGTALSAGDIAAAGHELQLQYRASVPRWELLNPAASGGTFDLPGTIHAATGKTTPVGADELGIADSAASYALKKLTLSNLVGYAQGIFDTRYAISGSGGGGVDPYFSFVKSLLPLTGSNGSTTITDITGKSWTANNGAAISTAKSRFAGSSLLLDGVNDYCETAASADWNFGTGDFHISLWMRSGQTSGSNIGMIGLNNASTGHWRVGNRAGSANSFSFNFYDAGAYKDINSGYYINDNRWHYCEVERRGGVFILWVDRLRVFVNDSLTAFSVGASTGALRLGYNAADNTYYSGYLQDVRITKGSAREDYPVPVPSTAAPTS